MKATPSKATIAGAEPQLFVKDVEKACEFFLEKLGFTLVFSHGTPAGYAQVGRDAARLNLRRVEETVIEPAVRDREELLSVSMTVATTEEIKLLFLEFQSAGVAFHRNLEEQTWGAVNFVVKDPDGNLLLFAGPAGGSRRQFLTSVAMTAVAAMDTADPRVAGIVATTLGIDTHNHVDVPLNDAEMPGPDMDLAGELKRSGLAAICMTFATDYQPGDAYDRFLKGLAAMDRQLERNAMKRSQTPADVRAAHKNRQPAVIQAIEGGHFLQGKLERVEGAYKRGLRQLGLLHDSDASVPLGDVYTNPPRYGGLTPFGRDVIKECNRLGILVDLAHANLQTTEAALKLTTRPVIISHTGLDTQLGNNPSMARMMRARLISKEQARMIANAAGLVGVWTHLSDTPLEYAPNIRALVDVIGVDHVCIGTDTKLTQPSPRGPGQGPQRARSGERTNDAWPDETTGFYFVVVDAMLKTGFTPDEIGKIGGGNFLRVFGEAGRK